LPKRGYGLIEKLFRGAQDGADRGAVAADNTERECDEFVIGAGSDVIKKQVFENTQSGVVAGVMAGKLLAREFVDGRGVESDETNTATRQPRGNVQVEEAPTGGEGVGSGPGSGLE